MRAPHLDRRARSITSLGELSCGSLLRPEHHLHDRGPPRLLNRSAHAILEPNGIGIGKTLAAVVVAEAGDITRFRSAKALGCYAGLTPSDHSTSGRTLHGGITREGSPHLRWALTQAAMACLRARSGPGLAAGHWIRAKEKRMGIKAKARAAGARKLAEGIWRLFHHGECFDPARPFGSRTASA